MNYEIIDGGTRIAITVVQTVKFDFMEESIDIPHFEPQSENDITLGIENRYITEWNKLNNIE